MRTDRLQGDCSGILPLANTVSPAGKITWKTPIELVQFFWGGAAAYASMDCRFAVEVLGLLWDGAGPGLLEPVGDPDMDDVLIEVGLYTCEIDG